jgi:hypothetical protein
MAMHKQFSFNLILALFILSACVVPPSLDSSSNIDPSSQVNTSSTSVDISESQSSIDLKAYFQVVSVSTQFINNPRNAVIQVRLSGSTLTEASIIQGIMLIANDFYEAELANIGILRLDLTLQLYDLTQGLNTSPSFGDALFVINESDTLLGIQLKEERIVLA